MIRRVPYHAPQPYAPTPYRLVVFTGRSAYHGWTEQQSYPEARLPGAGSFLYPGLRAVRAAAMAFLALPETTQVSVRTNQDRKVYVFHKGPGGRISGYRPD